MSKVKYVKRVLKVESATWASDVLTMVITGHGLVTGENVTVFAGHGPWQLDGVVTVVDVNTVSIPCTEQYAYINGAILETRQYNTGFVGRIPFTLPRSVGSSAVVQTYVTGVGGASYTLELSLDGIHWVVAATMTHALVDGDSEFNTIEPAWAYAAVNIQSIGAATSITIMHTA